MFIEHQAQFWIKNICKCNIEHLQAKISDSNNELIIKGLETFPILLKKIYNDYELFEESDYAKSYHNLMNTIKLLYAIGQSGDLTIKNDQYHIQTSKENFKKFFKVSPEYHINSLLRYGFRFEYYKALLSTDTYKECDSFHIYHEKENSLLAAIKYLISQMPDDDYKEVYARNFTMFSIADYDSILLKKSIKRNDVSPLCNGILGMTSNNEIWKAFVELLCEQYKLESSVNLWSELYGDYRPVWDVKFNKGKKRVCSVHINIGYIGVELMLTPKQAKDAYNERFPKNLLDALEYFVNNQIKGKRATSVFIVLTTKDEIDAIGEILKNIRLFP